MQNEQTHTLIFVKLALRILTHKILLRLPQGSTLESNSLHVDHPLERGYYFFKSMSTFSEVYNKDPLMQMAGDPLTGKANACFNDC